MCVHSDLFLGKTISFNLPHNNQFAEKFKEAKGASRTAGSTGSGTPPSSVTGVNITVTANGTVGGAVNGTTESPSHTPSIGHKSSSVKSNSSASSGEVRNEGDFL